MFSLLLLAVVALIAGLQNALAGGGSFLTFPALLMTGLDTRAANVTSTVALFPGQIATGLAGRSNMRGLTTLSLRDLFSISLFGGACGALLLLSTPISVFSAMVPWLVLFATGVFAWGSFARKSGTPARALGRRSAAAAQLAIAIYGGYFSGGIGILILAALTLSGLPIRNAAATKNVLAGLMNASAALIFVFSKDVAWKQAAVVAVAALIAGQLGAYTLNRVSERILRICITLLGLALTIGLFLRARGP
jgi:uncharacterized membrane protein YfcA